VKVGAQIAFPCPIKAVLFDMDGTLTRPHQIDFGEIRRRLGIPKGEAYLQIQSAVTLV